jgi:hypothetical protein
MAAQRCANCGAFGPSGAAFCPFCGSPYPAAGMGPPLAASTPSPTFGPAAGFAGPGYAAPGAAFGPGTASPATRASERAALQYVALAGILFIVGGALGLVSDFSTNVSGTTYHFSTTFLAFALAAASIEFVLVVLLLLAFRRLAAVDPRLFSTPSKLAYVLAAAILLLLIVLVPLVNALNTFETCASNAGNNQTALTHCVTSGSFGAIVGGVAVIGIIALVGLIGVLIGLWRLGTRYQNGLFKAGAILSIFPLLNLVGGVLLLVAARGARERLAPGPSG